MQILTNRIAHTMTFVTSVMEHWLEWETAQWVHHVGSIWWPITPWANPSWRKDGSILFNDTLNTFYLQLYGIGHVVKDHSDSKRGNMLPPVHGLLSPISSKGFFYMHHPTDRITHTTTLRGRGALSGTRNSSWRIDPTTHCIMRKRSYHGATSYSSHHEGLIRQTTVQWMDALPQRSILFPHTFNRHITSLIIYIRMASISFKSWQAVSLST